MKEVKDNVREFLNAVKNGTATDFYIDEFLKELHNENKLKRFYKSVFADEVVYRGNETDKFFKVDMTNVECNKLETLCSKIEKLYPYVMLAEQPQQAVIELNSNTATKDIQELKEQFEKIGKGEYINKVMALNLKFDCNTTIDDFPPNVQKIIKDDLRNRIEPQIIIQKENNPAGLQAYLEAELKNAVSCMQRMIQESKKEGAVFYAINETYVYNQERAKLLNKYLNDVKQTNTKTDTGKPNPLLSNQQFLEILERAKQKRFIVVDETGKYKPKNLVWLAVFADELDRKKITPTKFADIERLFNTSQLTNKLQKAISQKNYDSMRLEIASLID